MVSEASKHVKSILANSMKMEEGQRVYIIYDTDYRLTELVAQAYANALYDTRETTPYDFQYFDKTNQDVVKQYVGKMKPKDLVVMIQSASFRLDDYRYRIFLFRAGIKNIEHVHLSDTGVGNEEAYLKSLYLVPDDTTKSLAHGLKARIDRAQHITVKCRGGTRLEYTGAMEPTLLNIGDYTGMKNVGGTFPIGEVFSESKDLATVNGELMVWGFPTMVKRLGIASEPFKLTIVNGIVTEVADNAPDEFRKTFAMLQTEGEVPVREFGLGLNTAMGRWTPVSEVTAFERQCGLHLSLGKKHTVYKKPGLSTKAGRFHIDVFADLETIEMDDQVVFANDRFVVAE